MEMQVNDAVEWIYVPREKLPETLLGFDSHRTIHGQREIFIDKLRAAGVALGYRGDERGEVMSLPALIVVDEQSADDVFSWLDVYANEAFPLSQFGRVISFHDWKKSSSRLPNSNKKTFNLAVWSSLVLGEILAQGDSEMAISELPLSRVAGTFSSAMARTFSMHADVEAAHLCTSRLHQIEADSRFARRPVSVDMLVQMWGLAGMVDGFFYQEPYDLVTDVLASITNSKNYYQSGRGDDLVGFLALYADLRSDSVEARVVAFRNLEAAVSNQSGDTQTDVSAAALMACAAFLVGRGTSHFFLLAKTSKRLSSAPAWFGLLGGMFGPTCWDGEWAKCVNGIAKQLRGGYQWDTPSNADVAWLEYSWLTKTRKPSELFTVIPKLYPRLLSIEIVPGVTCQFRFNSADSTNKSKTEVESPLFSVDRFELLQAFDQLKGATEKMIKLIDQSEKRNTGFQSELLFKPDLMSIQSQPKKRKLKTNK
jgi:hypothetical protein